MGGSTFRSRGVEARRIDAGEFAVISHEVASALDRFRRLHVIRSCFDKDSFGDIDFLLSEPSGGARDWRAHITQHESLRPFIRHAARNGDEMSILFKGVQLDFRIVAPDSWESAVYFCDDDPMGNALGRMARWLGARFGYRGLYYPVYTETGEQRLADLPLASDPARISAFFGINHQEKLNGFQTKGALFEYIASSKYYSVHCFLPENWDHATRTRNRKRKAFCELVEFLKTFHDYDKVGLPKDQRPKAIALFESEFPEARLKERIAEIRARFQSDRRLAEKFSGETAIQAAMTVGKELRGAALGAALKAYKESKESWMDFLSEKTREEIIEDFLSFLEGTNEAIPGQAVRRRRGHGIR